MKASDQFGVGELWNDSERWRFGTVRVVDEQVDAGDGAVHHQLPRLDLLPR